MYPRVRLIFIVYFELVYWCVFGLKEVYTMTSRPSIVVGRREHHSVTDGFASTTARRASIDRDRPARAIEFVSIDRVGRHVAASRR